MLKFEKALWSKGYQAVAGVDEVGRGCVAGPVIAAAVVFDHGCKYISGVDDSKKLSLKKRESLFDVIMDKACAVGVGVVSMQEIEEINILQASLKAMAIAVNDLSNVPDYLLIDGNKMPKTRTQCPGETIIKGDSRSFSIAAASIIAKVTRDRLMVELDSKYPEYGFKSNKGYASGSHIKAIREYGLSDIHRESFCQKILNPQTEIFDNDEQRNR